MSISVLVPPLGSTLETHADRLYERVGGLLQHADGRGVDCG